MFAIKVQITRFVDRHNPGWVECNFFDASGKEQKFIDKFPHFTEEMLDEESIYPRDGTIACRVISRGDGVVMVDTTLPWGIDSVDGKTVFEVMEEQIVEGEHL